MVAGMERRTSLPRELSSQLVRVEDAERAGVTWRRLQGSGWRRVSRGIYRDSHSSESRLLQLASVIVRLPKAAFSGRTAAWLHGLSIDFNHPVEVTVADRRLSGR